MRLSEDGLLATSVRSGEWDDLQAWIVRELGYGGHLELDDLTCTPVRAFRQDGSEYPLSVDQELLAKDRAEAQKGIDLARAIGAAGASHLDSLIRESLSCDE